MAEIIFVVAAITFKVDVSSSVANNIFKVADITLKVASVADISFFVFIETKFPYFLFLTWLSIIRNQEVRLYI